ncbi:uncharacterized protein N7469_008929 [Penicillium citrinum]|uniref:Sequence orphan n=1 Tax=Penicillium citrinum TaxID=5077 RepID=A0A9W9NMI5_PENCI|nr:uncharacterized protein N7469_008929 [Penicillium citrinum]KAJ5222689.1 hypothetical protein N7469_008929 [Penicillium citrinum]
MATVEQVSGATPPSATATAKWPRKDSPTPSKSQWNTKDLWKRLGVDVASAATAGALTCPLITIIDRTPFILIYTLYTSTYLTANTIDTITSTYRNQSYDTVTPGPAKFISTTTVNMAICVYKDARFAKIFGAPQQSQSQSQIQAQHSHLQAKYPYPKQHPSLRPPATATAAASAGPKIPLTSYTLFCLRDSVTIFASFNVPPLIAPMIPDFMASTPGTKAAVAQFACPALMQFFSTPMHLLGLDLYNRQPVGGVKCWGTNC